MQVKRVNFETPEYVFSCPDWKPAPGGEEAACTPALSMGASGASIHTVLCRRTDALCPMTFRNSLGVTAQKSYVFSPLRGAFNKGLATVKQVI